MAFFLVVVLGIWAVLHTYVVWRLGSVPWIAASVGTRWLAVIGAVLWLSFPVTRWIGARLPGSLGWTLDFAATTWVGVLFLMFSALVAIDIVTAGGWLLPKLAPSLRGWGAIAAGVLSLVALVQGLRPPVVHDYEVTLPGLPRERDGLTLVAASDLLLGGVITEHWLASRIAQIDALHPDLVVLVGDVVDQSPAPVEAMLPTLQRLHAPLGVWVVTGNHEHYAGVARCVALFEAAGFQVLRDRAVAVVPGLVLAGVDDLSARPRSGTVLSPVVATLTGRPAGATILLSHSPVQAEIAAQAGVGLMFSGHTHNGQIWPFTYLVGLRYPRLVGRYEIDGMSLIIGRGTGTWGPRMRLWSPGEILRIRLRAP